MYSYKGFLSQLGKALCISEIATEAPFPSKESGGLPFSCANPHLGRLEPMAVSLDRALDC